MNFKHLKTKNLRRPLKWLIGVIFIRKTNSMASFF